MTTGADRDPVVAPTTAQPETAAAVSWKTHCLNCGESLGGAFCSQCGQRALPPHPTIGELIGDAFAEFSGWDGKFAATLRLLVRRPGELTRQWIEGRRAHFISPLRLYLTASVLFFLVSAAAPDIGGSAARINVGGVDVVGSDGRQSRPERIADAANAALESGGGPTGAQRDSALADIATAPAIMRPLLTTAVDDPRAISRGMLKWMPRMLFGLLPLYALILMMFYRRRNFPEHLFFAIHLHAFTFIALMLANTVKFTGSRPVSGVASGLAVTWVVIYSLVALRRVYGGSYLATFLKGAGILTIYFLAALPAVVAAVLLSAF